MGVAVTIESLADALRLWYSQHYFQRISQHYWAVRGCSVPMGETVKVF
jgi:hypothetical protein